MTNEEKKVETTGGGLRAQILRGGTYLILRRAASIILNLLNVVALTKMLGVGGYGLFTAALVIFGYLGSVTQLGVGVYLIRQERATAEDYDRTFTLSAALAVAGLAGGALSIPFIARLSGIEDLTAVLYVMLAALPLTLTTAVPAAILERALRYKPLTVAELLGQIVFTVAGLSLAWLGFGIWGVVAGWWLQQIAAAAWLYRNADYRPRWRWDSARFKAMLGYGFSFSLSLWIWQARDLVNPLLVGHFAGAEGVGVVALTLRVVQALSFIKDATWRLSIAAFARIQSDREKLLTAIREAMFLQTLALGALLVAFGWLAPFVLPWFFGVETGRILDLYPFVALGVLVNAAFNMHSAALYVRGHNSAVGAFHAVHVALFFGAAALLMPTLGVNGYGWAELLALPAYSFVWLAVRRLVGTPAMAPALLTLSAFALALFTHRLGWLAAGALLILPLSRTVRRDASKILKAVFSQINLKRYFKFAVN